MTHRTDTHPKRYRSSLIGAAVLSVLPGLATAADYNYLEGGFINRHDYGSTNPGGRAAVSFDVIPHVAVLGEFDGNDDLNQVDAGAIFHTPIAPALDLFGGGTVEHAHRKAGDTDTGVGARAGLRWQTTRVLELAPEFRYVHLFHQDQASVRLNALVGIAPHVDFQAAAQGGDDNRFEAGLRYAFGRM